jgi:5-methylcytosine-specific restriction endonuclease McrA
MKKKPRAGGQWTEARWWGFIRSTLRKAWMRYPVRGMVLNQSRQVVTGKRHRFEYRCAHCYDMFPSKEVQVDHIVPCGSLQSDPAGYLNRLFCEPKDLQVLCKPCHHIKTQQERADARK